MASPALRVMGVDPGTRKLGWGVIEQQGSRLQHIAHGVIAPRGEALIERLCTIDAELTVEAKRYAPHSAAVETIFYSKNAQSAAKLGHARGVVLVSLHKVGVEVFEYAPALVKRAVAGSGRAEKMQVARVVASLLGLVELPPEDAADALALALTHLQVARFEAALGARR